MDDVARGRRLLLTLAIACILHASACADGAGKAAVRPRAGAATAADAGADPTPRKAPLGAGFVPMGRVTASEHALGASGAEVLASDSDGIGALGRGEPVAQGFTLVERHAAGGTYAMKRIGDGWEFYAEDGAGRVTLDPRKSPEIAQACATCHADAPRDGVFPVR